MSAKYFIAIKMSSKYLILFGWKHVIYIFILYELNVPFQHRPQRGGGCGQLQLGLPPGLGPAVPAPRPRLPRDLGSEGRVRARA